MSHNALLVVGRQFLGLCFSFKAKHRSLVASVTEGCPASPADVPSSQQGGLGPVLAPLTCLLVLWLFGAGALGWAECSPVGMKQEEALVPSR